MGHFGCVAVQSYLIFSTTLPLVVVVKAWVAYPRSQNGMDFWQTRFCSLSSRVAEGLLTG